MRTETQMLERMRSAIAGLTHSSARSDSMEPEPPITKSRFDFQTFGESSLSEMLQSADGFVDAIESKQRPHWLSFLGNCGTGKTFLARQIFRRFEGHFRAEVKSGDDEITYGSDWIYCPRAAESLQRGETPEVIYHATRTKFVVIDDIGMAYDKSGYATNRLATLLGSRVGKWTIITANIGLDRIAESIDERVASRMIRDENRTIDVKAKDFALRGRK